MFLHESREKLSKRIVASKCMVLRHVKYALLESSCKFVDQTLCGASFLLFNGLAALPWRDARNSLLLNLVIEFAQILKSMAESICLFKNIEFWKIKKFKIFITLYRKLPPRHGLALKLSPRNSPVLEVAPLSPIGNFPMQNFFIGKFIMAQSNFRSGASSPYREFPYAKFPYRRIPYAPVPSCNLDQYQIR